MATRYYLDGEGLRKVIEKYFYTDIFPQSDDIRKIITSDEAYKDIEAKTNFQKKKKLAQILKEKIKEYLEIFEEW